jgi:hypothetical protein
MEKTGWGRRAGLLRIREGRDWCVEMSMSRKRRVRLSRLMVAHM